MIDILKESFTYEPETGRFYWKHRPRSHFRSEGQWRRQNQLQAGTEAFTYVSLKGYRTQNLSYKGVAVKLYSHRVAWALVHGRFPRNQIDHKNWIRDDNQLNNLRDVTPRQNARNRGPEFRKKSPKPTLKGVYLAPGAKSYHSTIMIKGVSYYLGSFKTERQAHKAYMSMKQKKGA